MAKLANALVLETSPERVTGSSPVCGIMALWRNGKRDDLKSRCPKGLAGSNPARAIKNTGIVN